MGAGLAWRPRARYTSLVMNPLILVIEDDVKIAELVRLYLEKEGYRVLVSHDGQEGLELALKAKPKLLILDRMLPNLEGLEVLKQLRSQTSLPVIILSAKSDEVEKVVGLELGADDYVSKPFSPKELVARVKTVLRRTKQNENSTPNTVADEVIEIEGLYLDPSKMRVELDRNEVALSSIEFKLLHFFASHPGRVYTRDQLMSEIYQSSQNLVYDRTIDAHVKNLRKKLKENAKKPRFIASVFGVGYKFLEYETHT